MKAKNISELQKQGLRVMQALWGVVSPNFRMVSVSIQKAVVVDIVLEKDVVEDREEIEDMKSEFEALQPRATDFEIRVTIQNEEELLWPSEPSMVVYRRREDRI